MGRSMNGKALMVTVIMPTYGQAQFIAEAIRSVLDQTHRNLELLIYDACSPDGTDRVVSEFAADARVTYIREPDRGQADAINKGMTAAQGDIVCWLNSDDLFFDHEVLARVTEVFAQRHDVDIVTGNGRHVAADGRPGRPIVVASPSLLTESAMRLVDHMLQPATFWRRSGLRLDTSYQYAFDWKYFVELRQRGAKLLYMPEFLAKYRLHASGKTVQDSAARRLELVRVLDFGGAPWPFRLWARGIWCTYAMSERTRIGFLKTLARWANSAAYFISRRRIAG